MNRAEDPQDSEGQSHHADQQARQADVERAFERAYGDWQFMKGQWPEDGNSSQSDWALIAWGLGVTDLYKLLKEKQNEVG